MVDIFVREDGLPEPALRGDEAATFLGSIERLRSTFAWKFSGLTEEQLRRTVGASTLTLIGLVKHLALVEDDHVCRWLRGEPYGPPWDDPAFADAPEDRWESSFRVAPEESSAEVIALWQAAVLRSRAEFEAATTDGTLASDTAVRDDGTPVLLRRAVADLIEEYARHLGHADLLRESIDGQVGEDPPDGPVAAYPPPR